MSRLDINAEEIYELYFRFTGTVDFSSESGSAGKGRVHPSPHLWPERGGSQDRRSGRTD